ncbi:NADH dehydrogenase subunit 5 (mitochondrion) [Kudoa iwatai]|uniref:NADH dehydrogenase subunit 5 n=1 Tax=Kudoa iwatai TaxID=269814 RepID=A0A1R3UE92_9CNID|nr:NADH dehydrogenase subunit 5 [Kudoa iwatai]
MLISFICFYVSLWVMVCHNLFVRKGSPSKVWLWLLCLASLLFYSSTGVFYLIISWSFMGIISSIIVFRKPTYYNMVSSFSLVLVSFLSTFLGLSFLIFVFLDKDQWLDLSWSYPSFPLSFHFSFFLFFFVSMKGLMFPFSFWILEAMKGVSVMSGLVHSISVVFSGLYLFILLVFEGWCLFSFLECYSVLFLFSSWFHSFLLFYDIYVKRILAISTSFSVNLCHLSFLWDFRFSIWYGFVHAFSKSFLFLCVFSRVNFLWKLISGLLSGFPLTAVWYMKRYYLHHIFPSFVFYVWVMIVYLVLYVKLSFKFHLSCYKNIMVICYGRIWVTLSFLFGMLFIY